MDLPIKKRISTQKSSGYKTSKLKTVKKNLDLYLLLIPGLIFILVFRYTPMYGLVIAFQNYNIFDGVRGSEWVGLQQFEKLFHSAQFFQVLRNTLLISIYKIVVLFPIPIFIAVVLNEIRFMFFKRSVQTIIYLPHFLSWVIISGLVINVLSPSTGIINNVIVSLGGKPISFLMDNHWFRSVVVISEGWKEIGYSAIIYIASIAGIDQEQYEAAKVDGASRIRQILHITIPGIWSIILLMFILRLGSILNDNMEQILLLYNSVVYETGDVIGTYVYRVGLGQQDYSFSTAVGLFDAVIGFILVMAGNFISKKSTGRSVW